MINGEKCVNFFQTQFNKCYTCDYMELTANGIATGLACNVCKKQEDNNGIHEY